MKCEYSEDSLKSFVDSWRTEELPQKIASLRNLSSFSKHLEHSCIQKDILPPLKDTLEKEDDDEVLLVIAEELGKFSEFGASLLVLPFLEYLARAEDTQVRSGVANSILQIANAIPSDSVHSNLVVEEHFYKLLLRLGTSDRFGPRALSCEIFPFIYSRCKESTKSEFRALFRSLVDDKDPYVRKAAFQFLKDLILLMDEEIVSAECPELLKLLGKEEADYIRLYAVQSTLALAKQGTALTRSKTKIFFDTLFADKFWRVRCTAAKHFGEIIAVMKEQDSKAEFVSHFIKLLMDQEVEVRVAASEQIGIVCQHISSESVESGIVPTLDILVRDESHFVRSALAGVICNLSIVASKPSGAEHLFGLISTLLKDENSNVCWTMVSNLEKIINLFPDDTTLSKIVPIVFGLCDEKQWRVRMEAINSLSLFAQRWDSDRFCQSFGAHILDFLEDCVFAIRASAIKNIHKLTIIYGEQWFFKFVFPKIAELSSSNNYLSRITMTSMLSNICSVVSNDAILLECLNVLIALSDDKVPNVRLNVCKALRSYVKVVGQNVIEKKISPILIKFKTDVDPDVVYFASIVFDDKI